MQENCGPTHGADSSGVGDQPPRGTQSLSGELAKNGRSPIESAMSRPQSFLGFPVPSWLIFPCIQNQRKHYG
jgi:hypothetical protein